MSTAPGETLIKLDGIKKVFYTDELETHALSEIHLQLMKAEYVSISGPSGCGKTAPLAGPPACGMPTLLSILGLLDTPSGGSYPLTGHAVESLTPSERARVRN